MIGPAKRWGLMPATLLISIAFLGCGGGSTSGPPPPPPSPPSPLTITTAVLPKAVTGTPYSTTLQATGGTPPYTWALALFPGQTAASVLPAGLAFASNGTISGTATAGCYSVWFPQFSLQDAAGRTAGVGLELDCVAPLTFSSSLLPDGNIAIPYSALFNTQGGDPPIQFAMTSGSLPPGITLDKTQALQGTPSTPGKYTFTVQASDSKTPTLTAMQTFTLTIDNNLVLPNTSLPGAVQNVVYLEQIQPAGGTPPYHFALGPNSSLPPGLSLNTATGQVSGTPTAVTQNTMVITISDSAPQPASISPFVTLGVAPPLSFQTTTLPDGPRGIGYFGGNISLIGGRQPYTVQVSSGALPNGLTASANSFGNAINVTGVPSTDGTFQFTLKVSDSYETPNTATQNFQIRVSDPISITGPGSAGILYNQSYSASFPVTGGIPPYTWQMSAVPPAGFTFDTATGIFSGTPTGPGFFNPNVSVQDSSNPPQRATYFQFVLDIYGKLTILPTSLPPVATNSNVKLGMQSTGGAAPLQWSVTSGSLPPGLNFGMVGDLGVISGSPTSAGSYTFTVGLSDGNTGSLHQTTSQQLILTVKDPGQMTRNDTVATATPVSNITLLASISPYSDPTTLGPDVDYYSASAAPGSIVQVYAAPNNDFLQPPNPNSLQPVLEIVDSNGVRYQTCGGQPYNLPCINHLPGTSYIQGNFYNFLVPGTGTAPVTFFIRVSDARGDARPDFIYTFNIFGVN